jgi:hypothetical protein
MGAGLSIDTIDPFIIRSIGECAWDIDMAIARNACKRLRRAVPVPERRTPRGLFVYGAEHDSVYLCKLAQSHDTSIAKNMAYFMGRYDSKKIQAAYSDAEHETEGFIPIMLEAAARSGRIDWCLSHSPRLMEGVGLGHSFEWRQIVEGAAYGGRADVFYKMPGMVLPDGSIHCDQCARLVMHGGASGGREEMCVLAKQWGCKDYNMMATHAMAEDRVGIFQKAIEWGATGFSNTAISRTIGPISVCDIFALINGWFLPDRTIGFRSLDINMCNLAKICGIATIHDVIQQYRWHYECEQLISALTDRDPTYGCQSADEVLSCCHHNMRLCHLAKAWGSTKYSEMLTRAARYDIVELAALAIEWGATNFDEAMAIIQREHEQNPSHDRVAYVIDNEVRRRGQE